MAHPIVWHCLFTTHYSDHHLLCHINCKHLLLVKQFSNELFVCGHPTSGTAFTTLLGVGWQNSSTVKVDSHIPCHSHAVPLPCHSTKGLDCVFPIWFTQCGRVWFTHVMPFPCRSPAMPRICLSESGLSRPRQVRGRLAAGSRHGVCE
jgi:hypothetical protein